MSALVWEAPPPITGRKGGPPGRMAAFVADLKLRPGQWAIYPHSRFASQSTRLRRRYNCETRTVGTASDCTIYARWVETP